MAWWARWHGFLRLWVWATLFFASTAQALYAGSVRSVFHKRTPSIKQIGDFLKRRHECNEILGGLGEKWSQKTIDEIKTTPESAAVLEEYLWSQAVGDILTSASAPRYLVLPEYLDSIESGIQKDLSVTRKINTNGLSLASYAEKLKARAQELYPQLQILIQKASEKTHPTAADISLPKGGNGFQSPKISKQGEKPETWAKSIEMQIATHIENAAGSIWGGNFIPIPRKIEKDFRDTHAVFRIDYLADRILIDLMRGGQAAHFWRTSLHLPEDWNRIHSQGKVYTHVLREMLEATLRTRFTYALWQQFCDYETAGYPTEMPNDFSYDELVLLQHDSQNNRRPDRSPLVLNRWSSTDRNLNDSATAEATLQKISQLTPLRQLEALLLQLEKNQWNWKSVRQALKQEALRPFFDILSEENPNDALELLYMKTEEIDSQLLRAHLTKNQIEKYEIQFQESETHANNLLNQLAPRSADFFETDPAWKIAAAQANKNKFVFETAATSAPQTTSASRITAWNGLPEKFYFHHRFAKRFQQETNASLKRRLALRLWRFKTYGHSGVTKSLHHLGVSNVYELKMDAYRIYFSVRDHSIAMLYFGPKDTQLSDVAVLERLTREIDDSGKKFQELPQVFDAGFEGRLNDYDYPSP